MRKRIYEIIEKADSNDRASNIYDLSMLFIIIVSLIPLFFKNDNTVFFYNR